MFELRCDKSKTSAVLFEIEKWSPPKTINGKSIAKMLNGFFKFLKIQPTGKLKMLPIKIIF